MLNLDRHEWLEQLDVFDQAVAKTPDIDHFCSASPWALSAFEALTPEHTLWVRKADETQGYVALSKSYHPRIGTYLQPLEASWGLASPIVGEDVEAVTREFTMEARRADNDWDMLFLSGIAEGSPQFMELIRGFQADHFVGLGPSMNRQSASLEGGVEGFMERRSSKFRSNIRRAQRKGDEAGVEFSTRTSFSDEKDVEETFQRILAIEENSWKGRENVGINQGRMHGFYRRMVPRLADRDMLRVVFATVDDTDVAYCFGGVLEEGYRGLQMSYHDDYSDLSAGNLVQMEMIRLLCEESIAVYDMGQAMDYKSSWTEEEFETVALIVRK